jgi:hypothetical protein
VRRWVGGGRLTPDERDEIADIVPVAFEHPELATAQEPLQLEVTPLEYIRGYVFYAEQYLHSDRTIKRWVKIGREAKPLPDFCPLDQPALMSVWWARNMRQRVPDILLQFAADAAVAAAPTPAVDRQPEPPAMPGEPAAARGQSELETGMMAALERLRQAEAKAGAAYIDALAVDPPNVADIETKQRRWDRLSDALRKAEKDAGKILTDNGQLLPAAEVRQVVQEIFGGLFQTWRQFVHRVRPMLSGKNAGEQDAIWSAECDAQFAQFQQHKLFDIAA